MLWFTITASCLLSMITAPVGLALNGIGRRLNYFKRGGLSPWTAAISCRLSMRQIYASVGTQRNHVVQTVRKSLLVPKYSKTTSEFQRIDTNTSIIKQVYETLTVTQLCGASCVLVRSPTPAQHRFLFHEPIVTTHNSTETSASKTSQNDNTSEKASGDIVEIEIKIASQIVKGSRGEGGSCIIDTSRSVHQFSPETDDMWTEELVFGRRKERTSESRLNKFLGGRIALRRALQQLNRGNVPPILRDHYGAPELPADITGSISHKDDLAVGVAALDTRGRVGVDIERCTNKSAFQLQRRILTEGEKQRLGQLPTVSEEEEVLLRFSFKEAVYKAIHPVLQRSVEFTEVETDPLADGTAKLTFLLKTGEVFRYHASWQRYHDNYWLTCVYIHFD